MSGEIRDATNSIALHLNVRTEHLTDQWFEAPKFYNEKLVVG